MPGFVEGYRDFAVAYLLPHKADGNIQSDAIHPGAEGARWVVSRPCPPDLRNDLLNQISAIVGMPAIGIGYLEDDALMRLQKTFELLLAPLFHRV